MLDFKSFTGQAMVDLRTLLDLQKFRTCDYTVGGLYMWREYFRQQYAVSGGMLICSAEYLDKGTCFSVPVGYGDAEKALSELSDHCRSMGIPLRFCCVTNDGLEILRNNLGEPSEIIEYRDWADYLYPYENFLGYRGKKLVTPRNHVNRFIREFPQYEYRVLDESMIPEAKDFINRNEQIFDKDSALSKEDFIRSVEVLDHFEEFGFTGGLLTVDNNTIGLSVGEAVGDTLYVHIEKAIRSYSGAYPMLASLYAKQNADSRLLYINREDDSGDEGLRHSKLGYHPCEIIMKYVVSY